MKNKIILLTLVIPTLATGSRNYEPSDHLAVKPETETTIEQPKQQLVEKSEIQDDHLSKKEFAEGQTQERQLLMDKAHEALHQKLPDTNILRLELSKTETIPKRTLDNLREHYEDLSAEQHLALSSIEQSRDALQQHLEDMKDDPILVSRDDLGTQKSIPIDSIEHSPKAETLVHMLQDHQSNVDHLIKLKDEQIDPHNENVDRLANKYLEELETRDKANAQKEVQVNPITRRHSMSELTSEKDKKIFEQTKRESLGSIKKWFSDLKNRLKSSPDKTKTTKDKTAPKEFGGQQRKTTGIYAQHDPTKQSWFQQAE